MDSQQISIEPRYEQFEYVETAIVVVRINDTSEIVFCNYEFTQLIGRNKDEIIGHSLDKLAYSRKLMADRIEELAEHKYRIALIGGPNIKFHTNRPPYMISLRLYKVQTRTRGNRDSLVCYLRKLTPIEVFLERTYLDTNVDFLWQPLSTFCLSGRWRPYVTLLAPLWLPYITYHAPDIAQFLATMLHL